MKCPMCNRPCGDFGKNIVMLGHPLEYWIDLQVRAEELNVAKLIEEIVRLKKEPTYYDTCGLSYYDIEERIKLVLRPKPPMMPLMLHRWLLKTLLNLMYFKKP